MILKNKRLWIYLVKFLGIFCLCYFGTLAIIGLAAPGGYHSPFIEKNLDYVRWLKLSLLKGTELMLSLFNISSHTEPGFRQRIDGGLSIIIAMDCVGYGVYSFWIAFVAANQGTFFKKAIWILAGLIALWVINVIRISLFLVAINEGRSMPLGLDHHTWFNLLAYTLIFIMIWLYDKAFKQKLSLNQ